MQNETKTETKVKGFKAMRPDMTCRDFQFEVGETFRHKGPVIPCHSGFHFCRNIQDIEEYYYSDCRIFEVEASGVIVENEDKTVTNTLTIIKEINYLDYIDHCNGWVRCVVANKSIGLDILVHDSNFLVRQEVAEKGYGLDILVNDEHWDVRTEVARQGYGLEKLVNDPTSMVRAEVARQGVGLDILVNDTSKWVSGIARQMKGLNEPQSNANKLPYYVGGVINVTKN